MHQERASCGHPCSPVHPSLLNKIAPVASKGDDGRERLPSNVVRQRGQGWFGSDDVGLLLFLLKLVRSRPKKLPSWI